MKDLLRDLAFWKRKKCTRSERSFMNKFLCDLRWSPSAEELRELKAMFDKKRALRKKMLACTDRDEWVRLRREKDLYLIPTLGYRHELMGVHVGDPYCPEEAYREEDSRIPDRVKVMAYLRNPAGFTFYPRSLVELTDNLAQRTKTRRYNFIGRAFQHNYRWRHFDEASSARFSEQYGGMFHTRVWAYLFAKEHFSKGDFFMITDASAFFSKKDESMDYCSPDRDFDFSHGENPGKASNQNLSFSEFRKILCGSEFTLCPAGDEQWSHRFHEAIFCMSIPVVENERHTWRNHVESLMQFHYVTPDQPHEYDYGKALENRDKLLRHMTFTKDYLPDDSRKLARAFAQQ